MSLLYLIRHPHTQVDPRLPAHAWDLSDAGRAQVKALVGAPFWSHVATIYPSQERKAIVPAERAAVRHGLPVRPLAALNEVDRRAYTAPDRAAYEAAVAAFFARPAASHRGWETAAAALARFQGGIADLLTRHDESESVAIIAHGLVLTLYMAHRRGEAPSMDGWRALGFGAVAAVDRAALRPLTDFLPAPYAGLPLP